MTGLIGKVIDANIGGTADGRPVVSDVITIPEPPIDIDEPPRKPVPDEPVEVIINDIQGTEPRRDGASSSVFTLAQLLSVTTIVTSMIMISFD